MKLLTKAEKELALLVTVIVVVIVVCMSVINVLMIQEHDKHILYTCQEYRKIVIANHELYCVEVPVLPRQKG